MSLLVAKTKEEIKGLIKNAALSVMAEKGIECDNLP